MKAAEQNALVLMRADLPHMTGSERRVAEHILNAPYKIVDLTIAELAQRCESSTTSVTRLCKRLGFSGYRELRVAVASATSREQAQLEQLALSEADLDPSDAPEVVAMKIAFLETSAIRETASNLDSVALAEAAKLLSSASRIDIFGFASSNLTGQDLHQKLHRIGYNAHCWADVHLALTAAVIGAPGTVAVGISHSGSTMETVEALSLAKSRGARTIAITNVAHSPITDHADIVLVTHARESRFRSGATASRIAQLALIDILFVLIAQSTFESSTATLLETRKAVATHRIARR